VVRSEDIAEEYSDCATDFLFATFASQEAAERFCGPLEAAVQAAGRRPPGAGRADEAKQGGGCLPSCGMEV